MELRLFPGAGEGRILPGRPDAPERAEGRQDHRSAPVCLLRRAFEEAICAPLSRARDECPRNSPDCVRSPGGQGAACLRDAATAIVAGRVITTTDSNQGAVGMDTREFREAG